MVSLYWRFYLFEFWAVSSVGQSTCFTRRGSQVQVLYRPLETAKAILSSLKSEGPHNVFMHAQITTKADVSVVRPERSAHIVKDVEVNPVLLLDVFLRVVAGVVQLVQDDAAGADGVFD